VSSHAASDTPQKRNCRPSSEQANSKTAGISEAGTGTERITEQLEYVVVSEAKEMTDGGARRTREQLNMWLSQKRKK
jgi:hypothetical protein